MLTAMAREVRKRNPQAIIHVVTGLPELFQENPDVNFVSQEPSKRTPGIGWYLLHYESEFPWKKHLLYYYAKRLGIRGRIDLNTYIYLRREHREWAEQILHTFEGESPILVNRVAGARTDKKNWPTIYWQKLIERLLQISPVIDIGVPCTKNLMFDSSRWLDLVGKTSIHQLAALMERSRLLIAPVSGPLHLASSVKLSTLAIIGGSEPAVATQYPNVLSLINRPECSDCWEMGPCLNEFKCLWAITPELVFDKVRHILFSSGESNDP